MIRAKRKKRELHFIQDKFSGNANKTPLSQHQNETTKTFQETFAHKIESIDQACEDDFYWETDKYDNDFYWGTDKFNGTEFSVYKSYDYLDDDTEEMIADENYTHQWQNIQQVELDLSQDDDVFLKIYPKLADAFSISARATDNWLNFLYAVPQNLLMKDEVSAMIKSFSTCLLCGYRAFHQLFCLECDFFCTNEELINPTFTEEMYIDQCMLYSSSHKHEPNKLEYKPMCHYKLDPNWKPQVTLDDVKAFYHNVFNNKK